MTELKVTTEHRKKYADLKIQAMLFDMDIDIETWSLIPKSTYREAFWLTRWKEKQSGQDYDPSFDNFN